MHRRLGRFFGKCYGSTTLTERGQIVIPIEARRELGIEPGTKWLIFGSGDGQLLTLVTAERVTDFVRRATERLSEVERILKQEGPE